ncbi:MAG: sigma-70 family RNA polymerase sigma factor [Myxococcota bacterium]
MGVLGFRRRQDRGKRAEPQDPGASRFEAMFHEHYGFVHRCARRYGLNPTQADDAAQEVFMIAHRRFGEFDERRPRPFLRGVAWRVAANLRRHAKVRDRHAAPIPVESVEAGHGSDARCHANEQAALVSACLASMPALRSEVFELLVVEGMPAKEVADALELSTHAVYRHVRAAKATLAQAIETQRLPGEVVA